MKVDGGIGGDLRGRGSGRGGAGGAGLRRAVDGRDGPRPVLPAAARRRSRRRAVELGTGIAVAFARNPMNLAQIAWDLQAASEGRFILGLGSQIKPHITKRFSMPWSHPAARMREMILAIRAIWAAWNDGTKLDFQGDFYTHTLMTPFFDPGPNPHGNAKIFLAGVGELMTEVAGEVCDGFLCHGFTTERYLREVTLPALERGAAKAGRTLADIEISGPGLRGHRHQRGGDGARPSPAPSSRSRSTARRPPTGACSSCTAGATSRTSSTGCRSRASGRRWASSSTTRSSTPSPWSPSPSSSPPGCRSATATSSSASASTRPTRATPTAGAPVMDAAATRS